MLLNTTSTETFEKYLGLPPIIGRGKKQAFAEIKLRIQSKLSGWKTKLLSQVGRERSPNQVRSLSDTYICHELFLIASRFL